MGETKRNRKIKKPSVPSSEIPKQTLPVKSGNGFVFCSIYHNWIKGTNEYYKKDGFTNMVSDVNDFSQNITEIVTELIPKLFAEWESLFNTGTKNYHCHPVPEEKKELVKRIAEEIQDTTLNNQDLSESRIQWWYIGFKGSLRLVGLYEKENTTFYPMFIDHHHLIHDNAYYNQPDFAKYAYCPVNEYKKVN